jgi:hypothetical protein
MNMREIERPQWRSPIAAGVARSNEKALVDWRRLYGFALGHFMAGKQQGWLYSTLDVAEIAVVTALISVGLKRRKAIRRAHEERGKLCTLLYSRLVEGYWPLGVIRIDNISGPIPTSRAFSAGEIVEHVIDRLQLPLPIVAETPPPKLAETITKVVSIYVDSDEFRRRAEKFRQEVLARRERVVRWDEASQKLGVPLWLVNLGAKAEREELDAAEAERPAEVPASIRAVLQQTLQLEMSA